MDENRRQAEREARLKARKRDNRWKTLTVCIVVAAVFLIGLLVFFELKGTNVKTGSGTQETAGQAFPYRIQGNGSSSYLKAAGNRLVLLNGAMLEIINPANGKALKSITHFFSNPVFDVNGKYVLTFDQGRTKLRIDTASSTIFESEMERNILTAAIGQDGTFAIATVPEQGDSDLTVYSKTLKELFTWNSMDGYIIEMDISTDGNFIAVATTDSQNGDLLTKVHVFSLRKKAEIAAFSFDGVSAPVVQYVSGSDFFVMTASQCSYISNNKEQTDLLPAGGQTIRSYAFTDTGGLNVLYATFDNASNNSLVSYTKSGKTLYTKDFGEPVKYIYAARSQTSVLFADRVESFDRKGELQSSVEVNSYTASFVQLGSKLYLVGADELSCATLKPV